MKFVADEGVDQEIVNVLRDHGHDVLYVAEMSPGITDDAVLDLANEESRILISCDKDFGELVFRQLRIHHGVMLIRLHGQSTNTKAQTIWVSYFDELPIGSGPGCPHFWRPDAISQVAERGFHTPHSHSP